MKSFEDIERVVVWFSCGATSAVAASSALDRFRGKKPIERKLNVAINKSYAGDGKRKKVFLDELDPDAGRYVSEPDISCGVVCQGLFS